MAGNRVKWILELQDRASGTARKVEGALTSLNRAQRFSGRSRATMAGIERLARANGRVGRTARVAGSQMTDFGAMSFGAIVGVGAALAGVAVGAGRVVFALGGAVFQAAQFREQTLISLRTMTGSADEAQRLYTQARRIALLTPFDTRDVVDYTRQLTVAGFRAQSLTTALALVSDVQAAMGTEAGQGVARVIGQLNNGRRFQADLLESLSIAGVGQADLFPAIARLLNVRGRNEADVNNRIRKMITAGRVSSQVALAAIRDTVRTRFSGGGQLGAGAVGQANSLTGAISNLRSSFDDLLSGISFENLPGMTGIKQFLRDLTSQLGEGAPLARKLTAIVSQMINGLGGLAGRIDIAAVFMRLVGAIDAIGRGFRAAIPLVMAFIAGFSGPLRTTLPIVFGLLQKLFGLMFAGGSQSAETWRTIGTVIGTVASVGVGAIGLLIAAVGVLIKGFSFAYTFISAAWTRIIEQFRAAPNTLLGFVTAAVVGFMNGIVAGFAAVASRVANFFGVAFPQAVKDALGIHSPSRVFAQIGMQTTAGFTQGIQSGESAASAAASSMVAIPAPTFARNSSNSSVTVNLTVQAPAGGDATSWAEDLADAIASALNGRVEAGAIA